MRNTSRVPCWRSLNFEDRCHNRNTSKIKRNPELPRTPPIIALLVREFPADHVSKDVIKVLTYVTYYTSKCLLWPHLSYLLKQTS